MISVKEQMRRNLFEHKDYSPQMDCYLSQRMYKGVYQPNATETKSQLLSPVAAFAYSHGNHKKLRVMLHEKVALQNEQKNLRKVLQKQHEELLRSQLPDSPKEQTRKLIKQLIYRASEMAEQRQLGLKEKKRFDDFVQRKLQTFEPMNRVTFDMLLKGLEELLDQGYQFEVVQPPTASVPQTVEVMN